MKRTLTIIAVLLFISLPLFGGEIYVTKYKYDADVIVYVSNYSSEADLYVKVTNIGMYARDYDYYWKFVDYKLSSTIKVYYTRYKYEADVIVYFSEFTLGWKKSNKFHGRLH